jgi:hypothetical protein
MDEKPITMLNNEVIKTAYKFSIQHKIKLLGSNSLRGMLYPSDFDFESELTDKRQALYLEFKKIFQDKKFMKGIYFMDFKCGIDKRFYPFNIDNPLLPKEWRQKIKKSKYDEELIRETYILRWKPKDVINGYITLIDGNRKSFIDCLEDDTIIKVDWIVPVGDTFAECSTNYYYKQTPSTKEEIIEGLKEDIEEYRNKNTMKSMKRFYSLLVSLGKDKKKQKELVSYFNSPIGYVNKIKNDLELLMDLTDKHEIKWEIIESNIQMLKENLSNSVFPKDSVVLDLNTTQKNYKKKVNKVIDTLQKVLNEISKDILKKLE